MTPIAGILFDIDGSIMPQGGPIDPRIGSIFYELRKLGIKMGPATGKNADYSRGLACGIGTIWDFISAESGAQFLELLDPGPPTSWKQRANLETGSDLARFARQVQLDQFKRRFLFADEKVDFRPELKEGIITLFPPGTDLEITKPWVPYFENVIRLFRLNLVIKRHSDGCIDVVPTVVNKRLGVIEVCHLLECESRDILTVVDGANDDELAMGTTAIAVSNAVPRIKDLVQKEGGFIADYPDGLGFAQGLFHYSHQERLPAEVADIVEKILPEVAK